MRRGYLALLEIGAGQGLVLGDMPMTTRWQPRVFSDSESAGMGGILIRCLYANSDADVMAAVEHVPEAAWVDDGITLVVGQAPLYLMDSATPADELGKFDKLGIHEDHLKIHLPAGRYAVATAIIEPDPHTSLVLHRLKRMSDDTTVAPFERD